MMKHSWKKKRCKKDLFITLFPMKKIKKREMWKNEIPYVDDCFVRKKHWQNGLTRF